MVYLFDPHLYASTLDGSLPFMRRRPSPPPATCYPREVADPYVRALAEEQAARGALQDAVKRERAARQRRAEEEARARIRERVRQRPQTMHGNPFSFGYPEYACGRSFPVYGNRSDEEMDYEDEYAQNSQCFAPPRPDQVKKQFQPVPRPPRSQSRSPMYRQQPFSPKQPKPNLESKISIPISSPSPRPSKSLDPEASPEEQNAAANKIQSAYRIHHAFKSIKSAHERLGSLLSSFTFPESLEPDLSSPQGEGRPKLTYSRTNAPIHAHEDALVKLLQMLDAVESHGDLTVREKRRELVREVEKELERIDAEIRRRYEEVRPETEAPVPVPQSESMDVVPETQLSTEEAPKADERNMGEDIDVSPASQSDSAAPTTDISMEVESSPQSVEPASPREPIIEEVHQSVSVLNGSSPFESEAEVEVEVTTPQTPELSLPTSPPVIQSAASPPQQVRDFQPESTVTSTAEGSAAEKSPIRRKVTIEDEGDETEKEYVVL